MRTGMLCPLPLLRESWLGTLELWFRKTGQQESFLSLLFCFCFVFFPPLSSYFHLALALYQTVVWKGMSSQL